MASSTPIFCLIFLSLLWTPGKSESTTAATNFIKASCSATTYPAVCIRSLAVYASIIQQSLHKFAVMALSVSLERAQSTKVFLAKLTKFRELKPWEYTALKDCVEEVSDGVDRLSRSIRELKTVGRAGGKDFTWHISNVGTWVSAALTDDNTCIDGFWGGP